MTQEFPQGKENYCPRCYFEDDKVILRKDCNHGTPNPMKVGELINKEKEE